MSVEPQVRQLAEQLGKAMAEAGRTRKFKEARERIRADADAQAILGEFQAALTAVSEKERSGQAIEPEDKRKLADAQEKAYRSDALKSFLAAQADYLELVQSVNDILGGHLVTADELDGEADA